MCWFQCNKCVCGQYKPIIDEDIFFDENREKILEYLKEKTKNDKGEYTIIEHFGIFNLSKKHGEVTIGGKVLPIFMVFNQETNEIKLFASRPCFKNTQEG